MKPLSFMPVVVEITEGNLHQARGLEAVVSHWTEGSSDVEEWFEGVGESWGNAGFLMRRGDETLGFVVYAPREHLPRADLYPLGSLGEEAVLLACIEGDQRTRRHLLVRMLKDLRHRGVGAVEAIASDFGLPGHVYTKFLLESGWKPVEHCWQRGTPYTLARVDMGSAVEVGELARSLMGRVKFPVITRPDPTPGVFVKFTEERSEMEAAGSRS